MHFDQPSGHEPVTDSATSQNLAYRRQPEPFRGSSATDRFDWIEPFEPMVKNKQNWFVTACLLFALSPLVVWTYSSFTTSAPIVRTVETTPEGPTRPGVIDPDTESSSTTSDPSDSQQPVGPSASFGGARSDRVTATTLQGPSSSSTTPTTDLTTTLATEADRAARSVASTSPTLIIEAIGGPILVHPLTTVFSDSSDETARRTTSSVDGPCHPDYSGCVPIVIDVDCADSDEDGPVFVEGPILVTGSDVYQIDANDDRVACFDGDAAARAAAAD